MIENSDNLIEDSSMELLYKMTALKIMSIISK